MGNPVVIVAGAGKAMKGLWNAIAEGGVDAQTLELVRLRASQINGCGVCVDLHAGDLRKAGASDVRIFAVAAWRDTPYFTNAERAALALGEAMTRLSDRSNPVPDELWEEARQHYDEPQLATLLLATAAVNFFNRLHVTTRRWHDSTGTGLGVLTSTGPEMQTSAGGTDSRR
jgi:AhpD family alkylhydroperoxidase